MANNGIYYSSGNTLNFTTNNTTWATLTSGGTFQMSAVSATTYYNLPPATFTGGTVSGATNFTGGLTANTISATTYFNLPVSAVTNGTGISASTSNGSVTITNTSPDQTVTISGGTGITTGGTYPNFTIVNSAPDQTVTISGGTGITTGGTYPNFTILNSAPDQTVTITGGTNMQIVGTYPNFGINFTGSTTGGTSGDYLPLSGGTVTGGTIFQSGVTANTISQTSYIDFTTGSTNPSSVAGRLFFDSTQKSLSYFDITNNQVPIAMGQQLYTRVWNASGVQIDKGKVIAITGTSNNLPSAILARNVHSAGSDRPIGLAAENIPNGSEGLVINNGILSGITLNTFTNGDVLYLSDTVPGGYVASTSALAFTARTNEIGYVLETGTTTGKIYVNISNEDSNLTLTDIERNILEGNVISTGTYEYTGMTINSSTTVNVAPMRGWIVRNTYEFATLPDVTNVYYSGQTGITITNIATADATYVLVNSASTLYQQTTFPTPQQRRENIFLGKVVHPNRTSLLTVNNTVDYDVSPMSSLRDLWSPIKLINQGVLPSFNTGLTFNTSLGALYGNGIGWTTNQLNPNSVTISAKTSASFFYRTQTGGTSGLVSVIDPTKYDVNGVITSVGTAGSNDATNQRIYLYPTGVINVLYGQTRYNTLTEAIANIDSETFVTYPNAETTAILIGVISVRNDIVADGQPLTNTNYAKLTLVSKFGESFGGTGGLSTTNLQQAYDNSSEPEILINSTLDGLSIKNGTGNADNVTSLLQGVNSSGTVTSFIRADGAFSGTSIFGTGLTATTVNISSLVGGPSVNNLGIDSSGNVVIGSSGGGSTFTGGTVSGPTNFTNGLTANTISATTYQNLPSFNYVQITGTTQFSAGTNNNLNFSGVGITITSGANNTLIFSAGTGGGGVTSVTASDGISGNPTTGDVSIINIDRGSSQNIFKNIQIGGITQFSAGSNSANLNFSGIGLTITSGANNTLVFSASTGGGGDVSSVTAGSGLSGNSTTGAITLINTQVQGITGVTSGYGISSDTTNNVTTIIQVFDYGKSYTTGNNLNYI